MFRDLMLIGSGGFIGSVARYLLSITIRNRIPSEFPLGTFSVNIVGCFAIGWITAYAEKQAILPEQTLLFVSVGLLGGFTTFSSFGLETMNLIRNEQIGIAALYAGLSLMIGILAVWVGRMISG